MGPGYIRKIFIFAAAITESWSDGQNEDRIPKLKLVKRQMYGRAGHDRPAPRLRRTRRREIAR